MIQWLTRDWANKLIALILAIGLWYYAVGEENLEVRRMVPVEVKVENSQMSVLRMSVQNVWVTLAAPRSLLSELTSKQVRVQHVIGPEVKTPGEYSFRLEPNDVKIQNPQIRVERIIPEVMTVTLDELIVQKVKIEPNFTGEPAYGYQIKKEEMEIDPNAVMLQGPKGRLSTMTSVKTNEIDLVGRIRSFRKTVGISLVQGVEALSESVVDIYVPLEEMSDEKKLENIPIKVLGPAERNSRLTIDPAYASVVLKGSKSILEAVTAGDIVAYMDISMLKPGKQSVVLKFILPNGVALKENVSVSVDLA